MLRPDQIKSLTIEFTVHPNVDGDCYDVLVFRRGNHEQYSLCYRDTPEEVAALLEKTVQDFYSEETDALERRCGADPDVAEILCPECGE